ncbi:glycosyl hydrolase [Microbacterium sp. NPDC007973]|uniref:glycosyl hydrolase n=1 Tax=Microbacterium sp. NPDC007973 TaxID=3364182 RepID=UPI0036ED2B59
MSIEVSGDPGNIKWEVTTPSKGLAAAGKTLNMGSISIKPALNAAGYYTIHAKNGDESVQADFLVTGQMPTQPDTFFGVSTHWGKSSFSELWPLAETVPLVSELGFTRIRDETAWASVQPSATTFRVPEFALEATSATSDANFSQMLVAGYGNPGVFSKQSKDGLTPPVNNAMRNDFVEYINTVLDKNPRIEAVEVWNEFNRPQRNTSACQSGKCYAKLVAAVYDGVKAKHPEVKIVAGNTSTTPIPWFSEFIAAGGLRHADAISTHAYSNDIPTLLKNIDALDDLLRKNNEAKSIPIIVSEIGLSNTTSKSPAGDVGRVANERQAAAGLVEILTSLKATPAVAAVYWYDAIDDGTALSDAQAHYGLFRQPSKSVSAFQPKQAAGSAASLIRLLSGFEMTSSSFEGDVRSFQFTNPSGDRRTVMWLETPFADSSEKKENVSFRAFPEYDTSLVDFLGEPMRNELGVGSTSIQVTTDPVIVVETRRTK